MTLPSNPFAQPRNRFYVHYALDSMIINIGNPGGLVFSSMFLFLFIDEAQIAILMSIAGLSTLLQIFSTLIYQRTTNRKRIILTFYFLRTLSLILIGVVPFLFQVTSYYPLFFILLIVYFSFTHLVGGGVIEWNDAHVPEVIKGRYYGRRNAINNGNAIVVTFLIGIILDSFKPSNTLYLGFFIAAMIAYIIEFFLLIRIPIIEPEARPHLNLKQIFTLPIKDMTYRHFMTFSVLWVFAFSLGKPLLNIYVIKYMDFSYSLIAATTSMTAFIKIFSGIFFGYVIDRKGVSFVVTLCGIGFALFSFIYIFIRPDAPYIYILGTIGLGIFMIGFNVAKFRLNIQLSRGQFMNVFISGNSFFSGLATFLSIYLSSVIIGLLDGIELTIGQFMMNSYQLLFVLSGTFHLLAVLYFILHFNPFAQVKEPLSHD